MNHILKRKNSFSTIQEKAGIIKLEPANIGVSQKKVYYKKLSSFAKTPLRHYKKMML
jgi:hypothetical protein